MLLLCFALATTGGALASPQSSDNGRPAAPNQIDAPNRAAMLPPGITPETKDAIERGLAYLARTQSRQGSWSNREGFGQYPVAMTSLAGLALLMDGNTTTQGRYAEQVDRAARYVTDSATRSGLIARGDGEGRPMYGHGFGMLFLSQLYGMSEDARRDRTLHDVLARGVELTARSQSRWGGWIYTPDSGGDEGSVTITQVQALRSCRNAGIAVPKVVIDDAMEYLVKSQNGDGGIRYSLSQNRGGSRPALTAAAVCCWYNGGQYDNPRAKRAMAFCKRTINPEFAQSGHFYYAQLYFAQAMYISRDPDFNRGYFRDLRDRLLAEQSADGAWPGDGVGDIYGTAVALIILQLPFNQLPIMQP